MARFAGRVAIVTGAGAPDGIGAAVARHLVGQGAKVVLGATTDRVHARAAEFGESGVAVVGDLTAEGSAEALVAAAVDRCDCVRAKNAVANSTNSTNIADTNTSALPRRH